MHQPTQADGMTNPQELRSDLDAVLESKGLLFARDLDDGLREDLRASWRQLSRARGGSLTSADIHDTLQSYLRIGLVRRAPLDERATGQLAGLSMTDEVAERLSAGAPERPSDGSRPTIARIAPATDADGRPQALDGIAYGSLSYEFGAYAFERVDGEGLMRVFPVSWVDPRFAKLVGSLARDHVALVAVGDPTQDGLDVWDLRAVERVPEGDSLHVMSPDLLEVMLARLRSLPEPGTAPEDKAVRRRPAEARRRGPALGSVEDISGYLACMEDTLPANIRSWAYQNLELAGNDKASKEERRHALRSLSLVLSVQWAKPPFRRVDPARARKILDGQLFGLDSVKQRVIETVIQINRTHTLPLYGLLLAGPAGVGKSQVAYAAARILDVPWASLDMSAIRDLGALIGSDRIYSNAKPGRVMEALAQAGSANMVLVINELDKADEGGQGGSSADALLTLFDNLGFTDNYIGCSVPTDGIYPIATANDLSRIDAPLLSRFEVIEIPDYTPDEKRVILRRFSLPRVLAHMGLAGEEFSLTDAALDCVIERYRDESGCRSLEKAAEHLAAHALFLLESDPSLGHVTFDAADVRDVLDA